MNTNHDRLVMKMLPLARTIESPDQLAQQRTLSRAFNRDGTLDAANLVLDQTVILDGRLDNTSRSNASTSAWTTAVELTTPLFTGPWKLRVVGDLRCGNSADSNVDTRLLLNGQVIDEETASAPSVSAAPFHLLGIVGGVPGDSEAHLVIQFKPSTTGTAIARMARVTVDGVRSA